MDFMNAVNRYTRAFINSFTLWTSSPSPVQKTSNLQLDKESQEMKSKNNKSLISELLECIICLEPAISPINACSNGHILCGLCLDTIECHKCPLCDNETSPSYFAERLVKKFEISSLCHNKFSGCKKVIRCDQIKAHLLTCEYRPIPCFETCKVDCQGKPFKIEAFADHLLDTHDKIYKIMLFNDKEQIGFSIPDDIIQAAKAKEGDALKKIQNLDTKHPSVMVAYADQDFLFHIEIKCGIMFWWITVLGGIEEAKQFTYTTSIVPLNAIGNESFESCVWKLPVLPIHEQNWTLDKALETGKFAHCHWIALEQFCIILETTGNKFWEFGINLEMARVPQTL